VKENIIQICSYNLEKHSELYKNSLVSPGLASCTSWSCEGKGENDINGLSTNFILWLEREKEKYLLDDLPNGSVGDIIRLQLTCKVSNKFQLFTAILIGS